MAGRRQGRPKSYKTKYSYIGVEGNTVRKLNTVPNVGPREVERPRKLSNAARRNRAKAAHMSFGYVTFLAVAILITAFVCVKYLQLQSDIARRQLNVNIMERNLNDLKLANDEEYARIMGAVDLEEIKKIAMDELGMTYPSESQIVAFSDGDSDYVRQYADIPQ